ncbi:hypothetical protein ACFXQA_01755 [Microbacterium sp. P07]|uniref:hypothetical protein n=1 Tax=Microbacterium sp. P07 TaxID=3366952 RepID=UPI0037457EE2
MAPSLEAVIGNHNLPLDWLTEWRDAGGQAYYGRIALFPGRGGYTGQNIDGERQYVLTGHRIEQVWLEHGAAADEGPDRVAELFEALVAVSGAAYGSVGSANGDVNITSHLPGAFWLNYFGPAFADRIPELRSATGALTTPSGGILVRTAVEPWIDGEGDAPEAASELRNLFPAAAFLPSRSNPGLPLIEDHLAASPGTTVMPWEAHDAARALARRAKQSGRARAELARAEEARPEPVLGANAVEWSTSFELPDWKRFAKFLRRELRGELTGPLGKALFTAIESAPQEDENHVLVNTDLGVVRLGWFIDDIDTIDAYIFGSREIHDLCDAWLDTRVDG